MTERKRRISFTILLNPETLQKIEALAKTDGLSLSATARSIIEKGLEARL
jgi:hypothetical protein